MLVWSGNVVSVKLQATFENAVATNAVGLFRPLRYDCTIKAAVDGRTSFKETR